MEAYNKRNVKQYKNKCFMYHIFIGSYKKWIDSLIIESIEYYKKNYPGHAEKIKRNSITETGEVCFIIYSTNLYKKKIVHYV